MLHASSNPLEFQSGMVVYPKHADWRRRAYEHLALSMTIVHLGQVVVFASKNPRAQQHFLVVPRVHIRTIAELMPRDLPLIRHMQTIGMRLLASSEKGPPACEEVQNRWICAGKIEISSPQDQHSNTLLGFHVPPFHSVNHLHMHCIALPFTQPFASWRYGPNLPWFVTVQHIIDRLGGGHAKVGSNDMDRQ